MPCNAFRKMLSRRPPEMRDSGPFYLTTISKPKGQVWFSRQRMGEHKIEQLMKDLAVKSGLTLPPMVRKLPIIRAEKLVCKS